MRDIPTAADLMPALQFSAADLDANRAGNIGDDQIARLAAAQQRTLLIGFGVFLVFTILATAMLFIGTLNGAMVFTFGGILFTILNAITLGMFGRQWMRLRVDLRQGQVEAITGKLERVVRAGRRINNFVLRITDEEFYVKKDTFNLVRQDVRYRFYRAPHSKILLAAEPLEG